MVDESDLGRPRVRFGMQERRSPFNDDDDIEGEAVIPSLQGRLLEWYH